MLRGPVVCTGLAQDGSPPSGRPFIPSLESLNPLSRSPLRLSLNRQRLAEVSVASEGAWVGAGDGQDWSARDTGRAGRTRGLRFRGCESQVSRAGWLN